MFKKYIGTKEFYKSVMVICLPIMCQQLVESLVSLVDNIMIGSVGAVALTSITIANKYWLLCNAAAFGLCGSAGIFIAQYFGAKDYKKCQEVFNIDLLLNILGGILFTVIIALFPEFIIGLFTKNTEIMQSGLEYLKYIQYSYIPYSISMAVMMGLRPVGINNLQLKVGIVSILTNAILNYILIYGHFGFPALGVAGAAIATLIARVIEAAIYIIVLLRKKHFFKLDLIGFLHIDFILLERILIKAIPLTANELLFSLANTIIYKNYLRADEFLAAAISVVDTVLNLSFIMIGGLANAISILTGNKLGANELEVAKDNSIKLIFFGEVLSLISCLAMLLVAPYIPLLYNLEAEINQTIVSLIRIDAIFMPSYVINASVFFILRAGGDITSTLIMDSGYLWAINVVVSTILSIYSGLSLVVIYGITEGLNIGKSILAVYFYRKGKWIKNITIEENNL